MNKYFFYLLLALAPTSIFAESIDQLILEATHRPTLPTLQNNDYISALEYIKDVQSSSSCLYRLSCGIFGKKDGQITSEFNSALKYGITQLPGRIVPSEFAQAYLDISTIERTNNLNPVYLTDNNPPEISVETLEFMRESRQLKRWIRFHIEGGYQTEIDPIDPPLIINFGILGWGSNKVAYNTVDYRTNQAYALIKPLWESENKLEIFQNEKNVLTQIKDLKGEDREGFVKVHYISDSGIYLEKYSGNLDHLFSKKESLIVNPELSASSQLSILKQLSHAVFILHQKLGYNHADLKTENVLIQPKQNVEGQTDYEVGLSDFGLAFIPKRHLSKKRPTGATFEWISPEVWQGEWDSSVSSEQEKHELALRADIFSLGMITYKVKHSGKLPFVTDCSKDHPRKKNSKYNPDFIRCRNNGIRKIIPELKTSEDIIDRLTAQALEFNPKDRPTSEEFFHTVLRAFEKSRSVSKGEDFKLIPIQ